MRMVALFICTFVLLGSEALAQQSKSIRATGCVTMLVTCPALLVSGSSGYFLTGRNLPMAGDPRRITVRGTSSGDTRFLCPTRLIMRGTIIVTRWNAGQSTCRSPG